MCGLTDFGCIADKVGNGALSLISKSVIESVASGLASTATIWTKLPTPSLSGPSQVTPISPGEAAPNAENITQALSYVMWVGLTVGVLALIIFGAILATRMNSGEGVQSLGRLGWIFGGIILISAASSIGAAIARSSPALRASGTTLFIQQSLWWYMVAAVILSVIIGGIRLAWEQRAQPGKELLQSLLTLAVVSALGTTIVGLLVRAADEFSEWVIKKSTDCAADGSTEHCFAEGVSTLINFGRIGVGVTGGEFLVILVGLFGLIASLIQIVLMIARSAMLVLLTGILPLSASFTNTEMGRAWFRKLVGWLIAFILYKPVAALIYASGFYMMGTPEIDTDRNAELVYILSGIMLIIMACFALPMLMKFLVPATAGATSSSNGGASAMAMPTGAIRTNSDNSRSQSSGSSSPSGNSGNGSSGSNGVNGPQGPSGSDGSSTPTKSTPPTPSGSAASGSASGTAAGSAGSSAAAGGAASGAGSAAAAGSVAGPVGIAVGAGIEAVKMSAQVMDEFAQAAASQLDGDKPDGSR